MCGNVFVVVLFTCMVCGRSMFAPVRRDGHARMASRSRTGDFQVTLPT